MQKELAKLKILMLGAGGGREHALAWKIKQSPRAGEMFFARGNAGTAQFGKNLELKETQIPELIEFATNEKIDLVLVVSDDPLALGAVDEFQKAGFRTWGPSKAASQLEWSKAHAKDFMRRHNLPTAKFETFTDYEKALGYVKEQTLPIVIKASGLALGKGVVIANSLEEAEKTLQDIMVKKIFGSSGSIVVIEEFLSGPEISIHAFLDGNNYKIFPPSQDHKKIGEGDTGPNTGGIGTITPLPFVDDKLKRNIEETIVAPAMEGLKRDGIKYVGVLYPGLILTKEGPKLLEFNSRFGDPETQIYMRLLQNDLLEIIDACIDGNLNDLEVKWQNMAAANIVLCSEGYPGDYQKRKVITGINETENMPGIVLFYAGTKIENENLVTSGGRVLGVSAIGNNLQEALDKAYQAINMINFEGKYYRRDIGKVALLM